MAFLAALVGVLAAAAVVLVVWQAVLSRARRSHRRV